MRYIKKCMSISFMVVVVISNCSYVFAQDAPARKQINIGLTEGLRNRVAEIVGRLPKEKLYSALVKIDRKIVQLARDAWNPNTTRRLLIQLGEIRTMVRQAIKEKF